jgi:hypothetical protein
LAGLPVNSLIAASRRIALWRREVGELNVGSLDERASSSLDLG